MVSSLGVGSGLPLGNLVTQLVSLEGAPKTQEIATQQASISTESDALKKLQSSLSSFQSVIQANVLNASNFTSKTGSSSDGTVVTITPNTTATNGNHSIIVTNLAQAQTLTSSTSSPFSSATSTIGTGTLTFTFGTNNAGVFTANSTSTPQSVIIDSSNNTLSGISSKINASNIGVNASVVNNGSGYLLVLTSANTGASNSMKISVTNDGDSINTDTSGLSQIAYDPAAAVGSGQNLSQTVAPLDSTIQFDGLTITNTSNTLTGVMQGATINLLKAAPTVTQTVTVSNNTASAVTNIQAFVNSWNNVYNGTISSLTSYNPETQVAGPLFGDGAVNTLNQQIRSVIGGTIPELRGQYRALTDIGVSLQADGSLKLNTSTLNAALASDPNAVASIFTAAGSATNSNIQYNASTALTVAGSYNIEITQAATKGNLVGSAAANTTITAGVNDLINITVDNQSTTVSLTAGTYTASSLAVMVQTQINNNNVFKSQGVSVAVSESAGALTLTSASYGSSSQVNITSGNGATDLVGGAAVATTGVDVVGTIGGEYATGVGQLLTGRGTNTQELSLVVTATTTGSYGVINFTQGVASRLNNAISGMLAAAAPTQGNNTSATNLSTGANGSGGFIASRLKNLSDRNTALNKEQSELFLRLQVYQKMLTEKFTALDQFVAQQKNTLAFLQTSLGLSQNGGTASSNSG